MLQSVILELYRQQFSIFEFLKEYKAPRSNSSLPSRRRHRARIVLAKPVSGPSPFPAFRRSCSNSDPHANSDTHAYTGAKSYRQPYSQLKSDFYAYSALPQPSPPSPPPPHANPKPVRRLVTRAMGNRFPSR